jgi:hypothetical protein
MSGARYSHFCFCLPLCVLIYDIMYVFGSWPRVFYFSLTGVIIWCCCMWWLFYFPFACLNWFCARNDSIMHVFNCILFLTLFILTFFSLFAETRTKVQTEWLKSVEATNCRFSDPVTKAFSWSYEICTEMSNTCSSSDESCSETCISYATVHEREDYTAYSVTFNHNGAEKTGCACSSDLAGKKRSAGVFRYFTFLRWEDGT